MSLLSDRHEQEMASLFLECCQVLSNSNEALTRGLVRRKKDEGSHLLQRRTVRNVRGHYIDQGIRD